MTLKEKFKIINGELISWDRLFDSQVKIADDYAIEFTEWNSYKYKYLEGKGWFSNSFELEMGIFKTSKQLLEIFKKEKGL